MPSRRTKPTRRSRLHVMVSAGCNNHCLFCLEDRDERARSDFSNQSHALKAYQRRDAVLFTCGEPTITAGLTGLVAAARGLGYRDIELVTNGRRLAYPAYCRDLVAAGLTAVTISIHGDTPKVHDALTRTPGSFLQSVTGLRNMAALHAVVGRPRITASTVLTRTNLRCIGAAVAMFATAGASRVIVNHVEPEAEALTHFNAVVPRMTEAARALRRVTPPPGIEYKVEGLPLCLMPGREEEAGDREVIYLWRGGRIVRVKATRRQTKGPPCARCTLSQRCDGVWIEYARRYGWDEFRPVTT